MCFYLLLHAALFLSLLSGSERASTPAVLQVPPFTAPRIQVFDERAVPKLVIPVHDPLARPKYPSPEISIAKMMGIGVGLWSFGHTIPYVLRLITHGFCSAAELLFGDIQSNPGAILRIAGATTLLAGSAWYIPRKYERDVKYAADYTDAIVREARAIQSNEREMTTHINNLYKTSMLSLHRSSYSVGALTDLYEHYSPSMRIISSYKDCLDRTASILNEHRQASGEDHKKAIQQLTEVRISIDSLTRRLDEREALARIRALHIRQEPSELSSSSSSSSSSVSSSIVTSAVSAARSMFEPAKSPKPRARSASVSLQIPMTSPQPSHDSTSAPQKPAEDQASA